MMRSVATKIFARQLVATPAVPPHAMRITHAHAGGPGGQNVNNVATKVLLRVDISAAGSASWLPADVRERLRAQQRPRLTASDELLISCSETRSQAQNRQRAHDRLSSMLAAAAVAPKERVVSLEPPAHAKRARAEDKRRRSQKKALRRAPRGDFS